MRAALFLAVGAFIAPAQAGLIKIKFGLDGLQEVPPKITPATGLGMVELDTDTNLLKWHISYENLLASVTAAHFHAPAAPGANASPVIDFANFGSLASPIVGQTVISDTLESHLLNGLMYANVHSQMFLPGEIRGQVVPAPGVLGLAPLAGLALARRRR